MIYNPFGRRANLYLHGGGFYSGSIRSHSNNAASFAKASSAGVLLIEDRLLPQYQFSSPVEDAVAAFRWLLGSGYDATNIVVTGNSVGGTLSLQMYLRQIATSGVTPAAVIALSRVADFKGAGVPAQSKDEVSVSRQWLQQVEKEYAGKESSALQTMSPINSDFSGFPPILLQVGGATAGCSTLFEKLEAANVDVRLNVVPGLSIGPRCFLSGSTKPGDLTRMRRNLPWLISPIDHHNEIELAMLQQPVFTVVRQISGSNRSIFVHLS